MSAVSVAQPIALPLELPTVTQQWKAYTPEQHNVWALLYERRMAALQDAASATFLCGAGAIGLRPDRVPELSGR